MGHNPDDLGLFAGGTISGNVTITGNLSVQGNLSFGDAVTDTLSVTGPATFSVLGASAAANTTAISITANNTQSNSIFGTDIAIGTSGKVCGLRIYGTGSTATTNADKHLILWGNTAANASKIISGGNGTSFTETFSVTADGVIRTAAAKGMWSPNNTGTNAGRIFSDDATGSVLGYLNNTVTANGSNVALAAGGQITLSATTGIPMIFGAGWSATRSVAASSGAVSTFTFAGANDTALTASTEVIGMDINMSHTVQHATGALTTQREVVIKPPTYSFVGASTITTASTFVVVSAPISGSNTTVTNTFCAQFGGDVSALGDTSADFIYGAINIPAHTITVTGSTQVTSVGPAGLRVGIVTVTDGSAVTIDTAAGLYIAGAPAAAGSVTLTNSYALWCDAGAARFDGRVLQTQGADVASANNLVLGTDGNVFEITGTTQINLISNIGWQNGSIITLIFTSTPTVKDAQATSTTNITLTLAGDFVASAGDSLQLVLSEIGGTQQWVELGRSAN